MIAKIRLISPVLFGSLIELTTIRSPLAGRALLVRYEQLEKPSTLRLPTAFSARGIGWYSPTETFNQAASTIELSIFCAGSLPLYELICRANYYTAFRSVSVRGRVCAPSGGVLLHVVSGGVFLLLGIWLIWKQ